MSRWVLMMALLALAPATGAKAARTLLAELLSRPPAEAGSPAMSALRLEACLRRAQELDSAGIAIDYEIAAIDREVGYLCKTS